MEKRMADIMKLARVQVIILPVFIFLKIIRPSILRSSSPEIFKIFLLSLPNFFEAVTGTLVLTGIGLIFNDRLDIKHQLRPKYLYILAVTLATIYVVLQELNIISLRSNTTFDPNDLIFSIIGLLIGYWIVVTIKPRILRE